MICNLLIYRSSKKQVPDNSHETLACGLKLSLSLSPSVSPLSLPWSGCPRQAIDGSNQQQWWLKCSGNRSIWAFASCSSFYPLIWQFWIEISDSACVPSLLASLKSQVLACSLFEFGNFWCASFEKYRCDLMRALELDFMVFGFFCCFLSSLYLLWMWLGCDRELWLFYFFLDCSPSLIMWCHFFHFLHLIIWLVVLVLMEEPVGSGSTPTFTSDDLAWAHFLCLLCIFSFCRNIQRRKRALDLINVGYINLMQD